MKRERLNVKTIHFQKPRNGNRQSWLDSSAALDADNRPLDLIVISLPKKFEVRF